MDRTLYCDRATQLLSRQSSSNHKMVEYTREMCVRGYYIYKAIWMTAMGEVLQCERASKAF